MTTRLERGLRIYVLLRRGVTYDAHQLAELMGVTRRTIFRDIALLRKIGLPIEFDVVSSCYSIVEPPDASGGEIGSGEVGKFLLSSLERIAGGQPDGEGELREIANQLAKHLPHGPRPDTSVEANAESSDSPEPNDTEASPSGLAAVARESSRDQAADPVDADRARSEDPVATVTAGEGDRLVALPRKQRRLGVPAELDSRSMRLVRWAIDERQPLVLYRQADHADRAPLKIIPEELSYSASGWSISGRPRASGGDPLRIANLADYVVVFVRPLAGVGST